MPTITDANVVLGYLNPDHLVGGALKLNADEGAARRSPAGSPGRSASPLERGGLRRASDRRLQHDPRHQGGVDRARPRSARVRAVRLRRQRPAVRRRHGALRSASAGSSCRRRRACSPPSACSTPTSSTTTRARFRRLLRRRRSRRDRRGVGTSWRGRRRAQLAAEGFAAAADRDCAASAAMHYQGQSFELTVPVPDGPIDARHGARTSRRPSGRSTSGPTAIAPGADEPVELVDCRWSASGRRDRPRRRPGARPSRSETQPARCGRAAPISGPRAAGSTRRSCAAPPWREPQAGPCIVEEYDATCLIPPGTRRRSTPSATSSSISRRSPDDAGRCPRRAGSSRRLLAQDTGLTLLPPLPRLGWSAVDGRENRSLAG